jgi:hypothetical protein
MIQVVQQALEAGDEASVRQLFDVFETLLILVSRIHVELITYRSMPKLRKFHFWGHTLKLSLHSYSPAAPTETSMLNFVYSL